MRKVAAILMLVCLWPPTSRALAFDPLGLYVGAAAGRATVRVDGAAGVLPFSGDHTGWHVLLGVRPISLIGAELEYTDFGSESIDFASGAASFHSLHANGRNRAVSAFGLLYAPIPLPILDVYGKAGVSRLDTKVFESDQCLQNCTVYPSSQSYRSTSDSHFAYGAGIQLKFGKPAVRLDYERIHAGAGDPSLVSIGATWTF